jgi:hypothetical protein
MVKRSTTMPPPSEGPKNTGQTGNADKGNLDGAYAQLTVQEIEALGDFARSSSVEREKAELAVLQASIEYSSLAEPVVIKPKQKVASSVQTGKKTLPEQPAQGKPVHFFPIAGPLAFEGS